jgi:5-methyltetrahydropteroyltriglutamate--homocysteine methyltransferase
VLTTVTGRFPVVVAGGHRMRAAVEAWRARGDTSAAASLRDPELLAAQAETAEELLAWQERDGVDLPSDGYVPVYDEWFAWLPSLAGVEDGPPLRYLDTNTYYHHWRLLAAPRRLGPTPVLAAYRRAAGLTRRPVKPCLFGPYTLWAYAERAAGVGRDAFGAMVEHWAAEAAALAAAGARYLQLEESVLLRPKHRSDLPLVADALARIAAAAPGLTLIVHLAGGPVGDLLTALLGVPGLGGVGLDFGPAHRDANLAALSAWRGDRLLQAGVLDARSVRVESRTELHDLLGAIVRRVPADRCLAAPSTALLYLPRRIAAEKLAALVDAAHSFAPSEVAA